VPFRDLDLGFHCSHEQHRPSDLLRLAQLASAAGFTAAMCSDHFHPWTERGGHAGFAWSWLGAALEATPLTVGTVCAPGQRYHPAVIAQAAATLGEMYPGRVWLAIGSGEAVNESITGGTWPPKDVRNARLQACANVMRALWAGETVNVNGIVTVREARLFTRPERPPLLLGAALTPATARWIASWADGLITVAGPRDRMREVLAAFREGGGERKPVYLQVALAYAESDEEARRSAVDEWPHAGMTTGQLADLSTPAAFDRAAASLDPQRVLRSVRASADIERHIAWLQDDLALGYDRIYLHNVASREQERFIDACGERILPALERLDSSRR
jgi:probable non-F420 flavinoid oxidoreductase